MVVGITLTAHRILFREGIEVQQRAQKADHQTPRRIAA